MIAEMDHIKERREVAEVAAFCIGTASLTTVGVFWCLRNLPRMSKPIDTTLRWALYGVLAWVLLRCAGSLYDACTTYLDNKRKDLEQRRNARAPIRQQIRWWIAYSDNEWAWLLDTPEDKRQEWATRRFRELIERWPEDHRRFETMFQAEQFPIAVEEEGAAGSRMLRIWRLRADLYQWARLNVTPLERVTLTLETANEINLKKFEAGKALDEVRKANPDLLLIPADDKEEVAHGEQQEA